MHTNTMKRRTALTAVSAPSTTFMMLDYSSADASNNRAGSLNTGAGALPFLVPTIVEKRLDESTLYSVRTIPPLQHRAALLHPTPLRGLKFEGSMAEAPIILARFW